MEKSTVDKAHDSALNLFNTFFGSIMDGCESEPEALKKKFMAELDAKIRSGDLKSDAAIEAYLSGFPELAAKAPSLKRDIQAAVAYDEIIRGVRKAKEYKEVVAKKQALEEKREGATPLEPQEENLAKLARFEQMEKAEFDKKLDDLRQKEEVEAKKPEEERVPLTQEEKDLKDYSEIQKWQKYSDKYASDLESRSQKKGPAKHDYWNTLEEANETFEDMKRLYKGAYENESAELNKSKEIADPENDTGVNKDKPIYETSKVPEFDDPQTIDWAKFREEVIWKHLDNLTKAGSLSDMAFTLFTTLFVDMATSAVDNLVKQTRENKKANDKKKKDARDNTIDANLKDNGLNRTTFARKLAVEAKNWILDTSGVEAILKNGSKKLSEPEKFMKEKAEFVQKLPKTPEGDIDFRNLTKKQQKKYDQYLTIYAKSTKWLKQSDQLTGVRVTNQELTAMLAVARDARPQGGLEHRIRDIHVDNVEKQTPVKKSPAIAPVRVTKIDEDIDQLVDKVVTGDALNAAEQKKLGTVLADRGVSKQGIQDVQEVFAQQVKETPDKDGKPVKPSEELRQSIVQVMVKGGLDDYVIADTMSKKKLTEADQAKIALQVDRQAKKRKALAEKMQALASKDMALAKARDGMAQAMDNFKNRSREGR